MTTKTLLSLATVSLLAFAAKAYTVETTNSWFSVAAASEDLTNTDKWRGATPTREEEAVVIDVDTDAANPAFYTPTNALPSASRYRVKGNMTVTLNADVPAGDVFGDTTLPKAALVAASVDDDGKWYAWHLTNASAGEWVAMNGATPIDGEEYGITIEFTSNGITYYVNGTALTHGDPSTNVLSNAGGMSLTKVGLAGYGSFGDFGALGFESFEVTTEKTQEELVAAGLVVDEGQTVEEALNSEGQNGLPQWQSLALGIDPRTATKPYTAPVQTNNGDLGFTIGNYGTPSVDGNVTFEVYECDAQGVINNQTPVGSAEAGKTATVTAPTGVKYYKIKIKFQ